MSRRGNNEGNIKKRADGRWEARVTLDNGERRSFYGKTRAEVARRMTEVLKDQHVGIPIVGEIQTVAQYLESWYETVQFQVKPSTYRRYGDYVNHIKPILGKIILSKLTPQQVQMLYTRKLKDGLSPTTVHNLHGMFHRALRDALRMGLVQRNITEMLQPPRRNHVEMRPFSEEEAKRFLEAIAGDRFEALYVLAVTTGMRQGELLGLRWQDIDVEHTSLHVRLSVQEDGSKFVLAEPKTTYSRRKIALSKLGLEALRKHRERQAEERATLGAAWNQAVDLVFPNTIGGIMIPDNLAQRSFPKLLEKGSLPDIRFHDLRHTAATLLIARGVNIKVVSEMLGHADISITLRVYAHVTPHMQQVAADVMDAVFS